MDATKAYMERKDPGLADTLMVVTADHDHAIAFNGYTRINNPILGKVVDYQSGALAKAADGKPHTALVFGNGGRPDTTAASQVNAEDGNKPWIAPRDRCRSRPPWQCRLRKLVGRGLLAHQSAGLDAHGEDGRSTQRRAALPSCAGMRPASMRAASSSAMATACRSSA